MSQYQFLLDKIYPFVQQYELISNSQIVDFFTSNLWSCCVPESIQNLYSSNDCQEWEEKDLSKHVCVEEFYRLVSSLQLNKIFPLREESGKASMNASTNDGTNVTRKKEQFHSDKKWHEIERLSKIVGENIENDCSLIIDAGAGKGYLSMHISQHYNMPVLAVEASNNVFHSALNYKDLRERKTQKTYQQIKYAKEHIDESTNYSHLAKIHFPDLVMKDNLCLLGLHTCGSLVYSMIKSFLNNKEIGTLCVVPCCYHLADSSFDANYNLTRNQRMLAQQRLTTSLDVNSYHPSLFYRAVLQVILNSLGLKDAKIGRGLFHEDFSVYAKHALIKIGVPLQEIPLDETLKEIYCKYTKEIWKFNIFHTLRLLIAPLLEITILLDLAIHLQKHAESRKVEIVRIFDSAISPRSYCIVAKK